MLWTPYGISMGVFLDELFTPMLKGFDNNKVFDIFSVSLKLEAYVD